MIRHCLEVFHADPFVITPLLEMNKDSSSLRHWSRFWKMNLRRNAQEHQGGKGLTEIDRMLLLTHWLAKASKKTMGGVVKWKYFEHTVITSDGSGDDLLKFDGNPKNVNFVIPNPGGNLFEKLQQRWISRVSSLYLSTFGGEKGMRETRVEWTEFTWLLITFV